MNKHFPPRIDKCAECGKEYMRNSPSQKWCPECSAKRKIERLKEMKKTYRKRYEPRKKRTKSSGRKVKDVLVSPFCTVSPEILAAKRAEEDTVCRKNNCYYKGAGTCNYILIEGRQRPCTVQGCTVYRRKGRRHHED